MVIGEYTSKLGEKKRLSIPKKFRDEMGGDLIITRGYEKSLVLTNKKMWEKVAGEVTKGSFIDKNIRETSRFLVGSASEIQTDKLGRFVVPTGLLEYANLKKEIVFIGLVNWVEVWAKEMWVKKLEYLDKNSENIAEELTKMNKTE
ncbi:division/cell wall cluster transcriptional repressor MraZ [Candidatus Dojkabacteria bacterium]|nr:division/cell wall cluster transcriptional repressor MraZ [Candidatus Dojkabacteria bacterium]